MTALCGGGTSGPKINIPSTALWGLSALINLFTDGGWGWLQEGLALIGAINLDTASFCAVDPPAQPVFSPEEVKAVLNVQLGATLTSAIGKLIALAQNLLWFQLCQCTSAPQPVLPLPPGAPTSILIAQPKTGCGFIQGPTVTLTQSPTSTYVAIIGTLYHNQDGTVNASRVGVSIPVGATAVTWSVHNLSPAGIGNQYITDFNLIAVDSNEVLISNSLATGVTWQTSRQATFTLPANTARVFLEASAGNTDGLTRTLTGELNFLCGTSDPLTLAQRCCPPDPTTSQMLLQLWQQVELIQRQLVPFAYVLSTAHAGLTGTGSFAVQGLLGVKLTITTPPTPLSSLSGNPPYLLDVGWLSVLTLDGIIEEVRAHATTQVWMPRSMSEATTIGYFFNPGVVATLTELQREAGGYR